MAAPFSSSDEAIINTIVPLSQLTLSSTSRARGIDVETLYDVRRVATLIRAHGFRRIALQFPDELLGDASQVFWALEDALSSGPFVQDGAPQLASPAPELYILADTSYGNCCVDEVAAEHVDADLVVHFGHACLSPTSRLPTIYVFHRLHIDVHHCSASFIKAMDDQPSENKQIVLMHDVGYEHAATDIQQTLKREMGRDVLLRGMDKDVNFDRFVRPSKHEESDVINRMGAKEGTELAPSAALTNKNALPDTVAASAAIILYVGPESLALTNLLLRVGTAAVVIRYDAASRSVRVETGRTNKLLQRRYVAVQKARDAQTVGLLVGTLGLRSYLPLLQHLRRHLTEKQGKRVYTISVGKLNPAKLANFQEIDVFVLVACPENSLVDAAAGLGAHDSRDFFRPIVTPFELLMAFKGRQWTGEYVLDLEQVFAEAKSHDAEDADADNRDRSEDSDEEPHYSLVTGGLVSGRRRVDRLDDTGLDTSDAKAIAERKSLHANDGVVTVRGADGMLTKVMDSAGAAHLAKRSWRGLEQRLGMDEAAPLEVGRTGIAKGYSAGGEAQHEGTGKRD